MYKKVDKLLIVALVLAIVYHGSALLINLEKTYDAYVHIFFADHYARSWFEPWEYRWYTGFPITSYPPLSHQLIALFSFIGGLKFGFFMAALMMLCFFIVGIYRFAELFVPKHSAGYAAMFAVVASSIVQTIHIYGQLPTIFGISCLMNALPEVYAYFRTNERRRLITALSILGVTVASHHVTTIFGMVFFIVPIVGTALLDEVGVEDAPFFRIVFDLILLVFKKIKQFLIFFPLVVCEMIIIIFPYWYWSKTDPITQVSIPHGSRDSFIEVASSGIMFFVIPLGFSLLMLPYVFKSLYTRRNILFGLSFSMLMLLGTGGTTPLPIILLGKNAFNILTLDRFTFWASVIAIPFIGDFFRRLFEGDIQLYVVRKVGKRGYYWVLAIPICLIGFQAMFITNFHKAQALQPPTVDIIPIVKFLETDQHDRWRFMTLGFGDQMAWLSAQTTALSIDGNYHSARRVPELTVEPIERIENCKFKGIQGIGSLQQFLTISEKYHLKFIFSNDKFYDPILYFSGWERLQRMDNGIMIWQKPDVPTLPSFLPKKDMPQFQKIMWGVLPLTAFFTLIIVIITFRKKYLLNFFEERQNNAFKPQDSWMIIVWSFVVLLFFSYFWIKSLLYTPHKDPDTLLKSYYHDLDFKLFKEAFALFTPSTLTFDNYILQLSVKDGLLASYGKLEGIEIMIKERFPHKLKVIVKNTWTTPLEVYTVENPHTLIEKDGKWFIVPPEFDKTLAPDEHLEKGILALHSQGKRKITTANTEHDDVLDRPEVHILSAKLLQVGKEYVVVGEIQNVDHLPAHLTIQAQLFDKYNVKLVEYNAKYTTNHKVLPKEIVPFRIEFEQTAWVKQEDVNPMKFNPTEFTAFEFRHKPTNFKILARAVVADKDLYRDIGIEQLSINKQLSGDVINHGTDEVSVPQLLTTFYDLDGSVRWVDHYFLRDAVRPQAKEHFSIPIPAIEKSKVLVSATEKDFFINGLPQTSLEPNYLNTGRFDIIPQPNGKGFYRIIVNSYIGNPTIY